jgi:hypothetical protein
MAQFVAYPPCKIHSSKPITQSDALKLVSSYLEAAATDPSLHPNALLTESGPVSSNSGANLGLVLHNLQRVQAGLRGEYLEPEIDLTGFGGEIGTIEATDVPVLGASAADNGVISEGAPVVAGQQKDEWQDKEEFEREQGVDQGELGSQITARREQLSNATGIPNVAKTKTSGDKEDRKKRKKERRQQEKRDKMSKTNRQNDMDET